MFVRQIFLVFCEAVFTIAAVVVHVADVVHVDAADAVGSRAQNSIQFLACEGEIVVADEAFDFRVVERVDIRHHFTAVTVVFLAFSHAGDFQPFIAWHGRI